MGRHAQRPAGENPFLQHALDGWKPDHEHIRYPVTFGLYREGPNLGLFLAPVDLATIRSALDIPETDQALVLTGAQVLDEAFLTATEPPGLISWPQIDTLSDEVDIVHIPAGVSVDPYELDIPTPMLACPDRAVPTALGSKVAIGLHDGCHVSVITPDPILIRRCIQRFVEDYAVSVLQRDADLPNLPDRLLEPLLSPMEPGTWHEFHFLPQRRYWVFDIVRQAPSSTTERWVCEGEGGHWRGGWAW